MELVSDYFNLASVLTWLQFRSILSCTDSRLLLYWGASVVLCGAAGKLHGGAACEFPNARNYADSRTSWRWRSYQSSRSFRKRKYEIIRIVIEESQSTIFKSTCGTTNLPTNIFHDDWYGYNSEYWEVVSLYKTLIACDFTYILSFSNLLRHRPKCNQGSHHQLPPHDSQRINPNPRTHDADISPQDPKATPLSALSSSSATQKPCAAK